MNNTSSLEIFLITYNRKQNLQETFNQIFAPSSPIKDLPMTILDNHSDDGTSELIEQYRQKFPNIKHIINNKNIGGNANAVRAFELATANYVWVLCDDDNFDFTHWNEVEDAMKDEADAIIITSHKNPSASTVNKICGMTFVPGTIYKTENITGTVITNAYYLVYTFFPQMALALSLVNNYKKIIITKHSIVNPRPVSIDTTYTYTRGLDNNKSPNMNNTIWGVGLMNALDLLRDQDLKQRIIEEYIYKNRAEMTPEFIVKFNKTNGNNSLKNLCDAFCAYSPKNKILLIYHYLKDKSKIHMKTFSNEKGIYLKIGQKIKIKLIPFLHKKRAGETIPVCFVTDENYAKYMGVTITSILKNGKNDNYAFYVLDKGITTKTKSKLTKLCKNKAEIKFIDVTKFSDRFDSLKQKASYISKSSYYKFAIAELLPELEKVIYLDCDLIISQSLKELYNSDVSDYLLGAVEDVGYTYWAQLREDLKLKFQCINSGVMLINCKKWRDEHLMETLLQCASEPEKVGKGQDQPVINYVCKDRILFLDLKFNVQDAFFRDGIEVINRTDSQACAIAKNNPVVIHYTTANKPWKFPFRNNGQEYWSYYMKSPFITFKNLIKYLKINFRRFRYSNQMNFALSRAKRNHYRQKWTKLINSNFEEIK